MTVNCKGCGYLKGKCTYDGKCQNKQIMEECYQQGRAILIEYVKRFREYEEPITKEDLFDELCFFVDRDKAYEIVYGEEQSNE